MKRHIRRAVGISKQLYRLPTGKIRVLPDFVIIGAQKCGTTFLYKLLSGHPNVVSTPTLEVHYFDLNFEKGINWYRSHFPLAMYKHLAKLLAKKDIITGESGPYYLYHPHVPKRMAAVIPRAKLIVLLRNPIDRAYSNYHHEIRKKHETLSFEEAIEAEEERLHNEIEKMLQDEYYCSASHLQYSYLHRGIYVVQLKAFAKCFDKTQFLILKSEELFSKPLQVFEQVLNFLNLPKWESKDLKPAHVGYYPEMRTETRKRLHEYFEPHNQRLYKYLGRDFGW